jgi:GT2 family glycosyltransferase
MPTSLPLAVVPVRWRMAILMACHNRRRKTLACLASLEASCRAASAVVRHEIFLVDDGSTDGTAEAVRADFPNVHVTRGDGSLYWCGGMRLAWREAAGHDFDFYLWLNDDVVLDNDTIPRILAAFGEKQLRTDDAFIVVGATRNPDDAAATPTYGALIDSGVAPLANEIQRIELFNGNVVLVSRSAFRILGSLSAEYQHGFADIDYGVRARRAGVPVWLVSGSVGSCAANGTPLWQRPDLPLWRRLRELHSPTGCPPWQLARLVWQNGGWWFPWSVIKLYALALFPPRLEDRP